MTEIKNLSGITTVTLNVVEPYNFSLSRRFIRSFQSMVTESIDPLRIAVRIKRTPAVIEFKPGSDEKTVFVSARPEVDEDHLRDIGAWILFADLDLKPFYQLAAGHQKLNRIVKRLYGLKGTRPASLFEMAVTAIIEQQISLVVANKIRIRVEERFGEPVEDKFIFPESDVLVRVSDKDLRACGLSRQKIRYIRELSANIVSGKVNLDHLRTMSDDDVREIIVSWKGFGNWSADYILIRGLSRPDSIPVDDIAIRSVAGIYLGNGERLNTKELEEVLEPFRPYRGLTAFYLLAAQRGNIEL